MLRQSASCKRVHVSLHPFLEFVGPVSAGFLAGFPLRSRNHGSLWLVGGFSCAGF